MVHDFDFKHRKDFPIVIMPLYKRGEDFAITGNIQYLCRYLFRMYISQGAQASGKSLTPNLLSNFAVFSIFEFMTNLTLAQVVS